jgi:hypothetical protein
LNEVDYAVSCVPTVAAVVDTTNVKVSFDDGRIDKCSVQPDDYGSVYGPKLFVILGSFRDENNPSNLSTRRARHAPFAVLFLYVSILTSNEGRATVVTIRRN